MGTELHIYGEQAAAVARTDLAPSPPPLEALHSQGTGMAWVHVPLAGCSQAGL